MKKAVCISCTHHYRERTAPVEAVLLEKGYECTYITSDFNHNTKAHYTVEDLPQCIQIPTKPYRKNISPQRILSHIRFARDTFKKVAELQPDLIYVEVPPNSLCRQAGLYKKKHPETKLIVDIFDMWPESFPNSRAKQLLALPFRVWGWFRNCGLNKADLVLTECDLFRNKLQPHLKNTPNHTLYLCRPGATAEEVKPVPAQEAIHLCYLGSINNIIDIPTISALIGQIQKLRPVVLHIIGDGETREDFIAAVEETGAQVRFHGKVYDPAQKQAIFDQCSFGLNIMKDSVFIGLTMKSLDYFAGGLPIINTIAGDTQALVASRNIGINLDRNDLSRTAQAVAEASPEKLLEMSENTLQCFHTLFAEKVFAEKLTELL